MKNMRGLYLNDIPVNTFMEYFNKTNLQPLKFTPKYRDDIIVNEYTFTLAGNTRYYKSMFPFPEISSDITEFFGAGAIIEGTTEAQAINTMFYNPNIPFIYPYRYRVWDKAGNLYKNFIEIQDSLENNIDELLPENYSNLAIIDSRDLTDIYPDVNLVYIPGKDRWNIISGTSLVGYIYKNTEFKIQATDAFGRLLYIDEFGRETTESGLDDIFGKHHNMMRTSFNNITDLGDAVSQTFLPGCIGLVDYQINKKLVYYEKYRRTTTFSIPETPSTPNYREFINRNLIADINESASEEITIESYSIPTKTVLDFATVPSIRVEKIEGGWVPLYLQTGINHVGSAGYYYNTSNATLYLNADAVAQTVTVSDTAPTEVNNALWLTITNQTLYQYKSLYYKKIDNYINTNARETMVLRLSEPYVTFAGKLRAYKNDSILFNSEFSLYAELDTENTRNFLKIPVQLASYTNTQSIKYFIEYYDKENKKVRIHSATDNPANNYSHYFVIEGERFYVYPTNEPNFPYGWFKIPISFEYGLLESLFGDVVDFYQKDNSLIIEKYDSTQFNTLEALDTPEALTTVTIQDILDNDLYVTKTEIYEKVAPTGTLPYAPTEFLDNYHSYNSAGEITLPNERKVKIGASITTVPTMNQFIENFRFSHYLVQGTFPGDNTSSRGKLVPEHVFKDRKHAAIRSMMVSFMEKRYDNFLFKDSYNLFEDDILMKMRVYAEGYKKFLDNDTGLYNLGSAKRHYISYEDVSPRIVTSKNEGQRESVLIKKYDTSLQYVNEELQKENVFTRLRESNLFPNNTDRAKHLAEQSKRLQAYVDYDKTTKVFNDIDVLERVYTQNIPSTLDYKKIVLYNLMENFYTYNNYTGDDKYLQNYESYIEGLEDTGYTLEVSDQTEKALYLKESLDETALLTKILQEDWKVL